MGIKRTLLRIKQRFYWPNMDLDVTRWSAKCPECSSRKSKTPPSRILVLMKTFPTGVPFDCMAMDILDMHKRTARNNRYNWSSVTISQNIQTRSRFVVIRLIFFCQYICDTMDHVSWLTLSDQGIVFEGHLFRCL